MMREVDGDCGAWSWDSVPGRSGMARLWTGLAFERCTGISLSWAGHGADRGWKFRDEFEGLGGDDAFFIGGQDPDGGGAAGAGDAFVAAVVGVGIDVDAEPGEPL